MSKKVVLTALAVLVLSGVAGRVWAGFSGTDVYLPSVARLAGNAGSNWYTTVWVYNPNPTAAQVQIYLHERLTANPTPLVVTRTLAAGETQRYTNAVQTLFAVEKAGALRFVSTARIVVNGRIYTLPAGGQDQDTTGQFFAGIPSSFAIGAGQSTQLLGMYQTTPFDSSQFRYNFGLVETAGGSCSVRITVVSATGGTVTFKDYSIGAHGAAQYQAKSEFPGVSTENARLKVEVLSGSGQVLAFGSGLANRSNDPSTFEMAFRDELLAGGSGGLTEVSHNATLTGNGTPASPLGIADNGVTAGKIASGQVVKSVNGLKDSVTLAAGSNVTITPSGNTLTIASTGGSGGGITGVTAGAGLTGGGTSGNVTLAVQVPLVLTGDPAFAGATIEGHSTLGRGLLGTTASTHGAVEGFNTGSGIGVWGGSSSGPFGFLGGAITGVEGQASMGSGIGVNGSGGQYGVKGVSSDHAGVYGEGPDYGVEGSSLGTGVHGSGPYGVSGESTSSGSGGVGVYGHSASGYGVKGESTSGLGVQGKGSVGVYGQGTNTGVAGSSESGYGVSGTGQDWPGVRGGSSTSDGVLGESSGTAGVHGRGTFGDVTGVFGESTTGYGVRGVSTSNRAVYGLSSTDVGVWGTSISAAGVTGASDSANGVEGRTVHGWAVYGVNLTSSHAGLLGTPDYGGDFAGDVRVQGTLSKTAGSFVIDHPLDPEHKYLAHSFVESPDMKNVYDGVVELDSRGTAVVELPEWFEALNRDFRYQLTCVGAFAPVFVAAEIAGNRFAIAGGQPGLKVSWQVTGIRKDAYAEAHRIVVEQEKPAEEQGTYLYPELFGQGPERSVETVRHPAILRDAAERPSIVTQGAHDRP